MKISQVTLILACLIAGTSNSFAGPTLERIKQTGVVSIGFRTESVPFSYKNTDEQSPPLGYSIEVCNALVESIKRETKLTGLRVKYLPVTGADRIPFVREGKVDLECGNTTNTKSRREQAAFGMPLYFASAKLLVREDSGIKNIDGMSGKILAVNKGTTGAMIAEGRQQKLKNMQIIEVGTSADGVKAVIDKTADAFITDDVLLHGFKAQAQEQLAVVGGTLSIEPLAIMFSRDDHELAALVDRELAELYRSGSLRRSYNKWFLSPLPQRAFNMNVIPNPLTADMFIAPSNYTVDWVTF